MIGLMMSEKEIVATVGRIWRSLRRKPLTRRERIYRLINARAITLSSAQAPRPWFDREAAKASYRRATNGSYLEDDT
jgi:hypothetical protein